MRTAAIPKPSPKLRLGSRGLAWRRLGLWSAMTVGMAGLQFALLPFGRKIRHGIAGLYFRRSCRLFGLDIAARGAMSTERPTLFLSNHSSYLDILVLGALLDARFVAKSEVGTWPLIGLLSRIQRTVFVDRRRRSTDRQRDDLQQRLDAGESLILFPEGTSSDGNRVLPFRSALLSVAERQAGEKPLIVQPISIAYTRLNGLPLGHGMRPYLAWYGDMELAPHFWDFLRLGRIRAAVEFHPPITIADFPSRKALARHCENAVASGVSRALSGLD